MASAVTGLLAFGERCRRVGVRPSTGSVGDAYDNALCESFFATLECELIDRRFCWTRGHARREVFEYIEGWYNAHRRHSSLGYESPVNCPPKRGRPSGLAAASVVGTERDRVRFGDNRWRTRPPIRGR